MRKITSTSSFKKLKEAFFIICSVYLVSILFPELSFHKKYTYKSFTVYFHESNNVNFTELKSVLDESLDLLEESEVFDPSNNQDIFLCDDFNEFTFYVLFGRKDFGVNSILTNNVFLSKSSISENIAYRNDQLNNTKPLSSVIADKTSYSYK